MKVSDYVARFIKEKGIDIVFELQGGMITRLIDALYHVEGIKIVSMHHEQAAAMAADSYGRIRNKPGVALATSGPGATNLLTGIGNCYFDSVPAIFLTGQVNINEQKGNNPTRQIGFQETDIVSMAKPVTKAAFSIKSANEIPFILESAYNIAISGRPGPVLLDIPMNIQNEEVSLESLLDSSVILEKDSSKLNVFFHKYIEALSKSLRPLILVGGGIRSSGSITVFRKFIQKYQIPVVTSLLGLDALPYQNQQRIGFIGTYGNRWANFSLGNCDLLLVLGSRLDLRQTGIDTNLFQKGKQIFHVDIDDAELNNRFSECVVLNANLIDFLSDALNYSFTYEAPEDWRETIREKKRMRPDISELENITGINPNIFLHELSKVSYLASAFVADVGNNQMWCSQSLELAENQLFLTSGGMGAMGYSLPAAIGAAFTMQNMPVVAISGDGGFQINIQELQTIQRNKLPIKIVILNNHSLGMIRQFQDAYFDSCYQSTVWGYDTPDFTKVALAYGIESYSISKPEEVEEGLKKLWENPYKPFLLDVNINIKTNVFPKMMFGSALTNMEPAIVDIKKTMK